MRPSTLLIAASFFGLVLPSDVAVAAPAPVAPVDVQSQSALVDAALDLVRGGSVDLGIEELRRLGEQGYSDAFYHLAEIHRLGIGRPVSVPIATMYYRLAAGLGHKRAALTLANFLFFEGDGSQSSIDEAMAVWQQYALMEDPEAMYMLGMVYWNGEGGRLPDPIRGYGLVWKAAAEGYADAINGESAMNGQLSEQARARARQYASALQAEGFSDKPIALYLVMGREDGARERTPEPGTVDITADAPMVVADTEPAAGPDEETGGTPAEMSVASAQEPESEPEPEPEPAAVVDAGPEQGDGGDDFAMAEGMDEGDDPVLEDPDAPVDWTTVWHVEVGFAMSQEEVDRLMKVILTTQAEAVAGLKGEVTESINRPGLYRLVFGPVKGMQGAVRRCVALKRAGYDCFAKPPQ